VLLSLSTLTDQRTLRAEEGTVATAVKAFKKNIQRKRSRKKSTLAAFSGPVRVCRFSHDGKLLAVGYDFGDFEVSLNGKQYVFLKKCLGLKYGESFF